MNILLVKKYYLLINNKYLNELNLLILLWERILKNKQKQLNIKEKNKKAIQNNKKHPANIKDDYKNKLLLSEERGKY